MSTGILRGVNVLGIEVRVLTAETHRLGAQVTRYGVEDGGSIADHAILQPNSVDVEFVMTNSDGGRDKAAAVFQHFHKLMEERTPLTLDTEHARYKNMIITGFTPEHRAPHKGALRATLRLTQVGIVGQAGMVSALGGRPPSVLAQDGTHLTASAPVNGGIQPPITEATNPALIAACRAYLRSK